MLKRAVLSIALAVGLLGLTADVAAAANAGDGNGNTVSTGSTVTAVSGIVAFDGWVSPTCSSSTLTLSLTDNTTADADPITLVATGSGWAGCSLSTAGNHGAGKWVLNIPGSTYLGEHLGRWENVDTSIGGCRFTGNLVDQQLGGVNFNHVRWHNGAGFVHSQIHLQDAAWLAGSFCGGVKANATWTLSSGWVIV